MSNIYNQLRDTGVVVADTSTIKSEIQAEWQDTFGYQLSLEDATIQGRIIELLTAQRKDCANSLAYISNQINPNVATGSFLEAIGKLFYIDRVGATSTIVENVSMGGTPNATIPAGSSATDTNGNVYTLSNDVVLGVDGKGFGTFVCIEKGAIQCPSGTLNQVDPNVSDWESVNNVSVGTVGSESESDYHLRLRIEKSKAKYSQGYLASIYSALYEIDGLKDVIIVENPTGLTQTSADNSEIPTGESIAPHSIFVVVSGGTSDGTFYQQVAKAILLKKSLGCGMQASVVYPDNAHSVNVLDKSDSDGFVFSNYPITFNTPEPIPIYIQISAKNNGYTGSDLAMDIKNVVANWFAGNIQDASVERVGIGYSISPFTMATMINSQIFGVSITSLLIGTSPSSLSANTVNIDNNQIAFTGTDQITVSTSN